MSLEEILFENESKLTNMSLWNLLNAFARGDINIGTLKSEMAQENRKAFSTAQLADIDTIKGQMDAKSTVEEKLTVALKVFDVFVLSQSSNNLYQTREQIRSELGFNDGT